MSLSRDLPRLADVIKRHGLAAQKSLGQHFLLDPAVTDRIAAAAGDLSGGTVIEVGPGPGGLTRALLDAGATHVVALEKDSRCVAALAELVEAAAGRLRVVEGDAMTADPADLGPTPWRIVANLPYNVGTPLLLKWLGGVRDIDTMVLMFQKEVARRITAAPGTRDYGRLSVKAQWLCRCEHVFDLKPGAFSPPPKVSSSVVRLTPYAAPLFPADEDALETVVAKGFGQRRKMLRAALKGLDQPALELLRTAGISPERRAETLDIEAWCALARAYAEARR